MSKKHLIITIDTEGDNLWQWKPGDVIRTENTLYLQRFQALCDRYGFKPTWLSNYEMICDPRYVEFIGQVEQSHTGELGMHLHAWNSPPLFDLSVAQKGAPYLIEYPPQIMEDKISHLTEVIRERTGIVPTTHRAGRWATNSLYFQLLDRYGYTADCSVTPHVSWTRSPGQSQGAAGSDYTGAPDSPYLISGTGVLEVPLTIVTSHMFLPKKPLTLRRIAGGCYRAMKGQPLWLRPDGDNLNQMLYVAQKAGQSSQDYLMFMLHSSEMMPGGSPTFPTEASIEKLYADLEILFARLAESYEGITLRSYAAKWRQNN